MALGVGTFTANLPSYLRAEHPVRLRVSPMLPLYRHIYVHSSRIRSELRLKSGDERQIKGTGDNRRPFDIYRGGGDIRVCNKARSGKPGKAGYRRRLRILDWNFV